MPMKICSTIQTRNLFKALGVPVMVDICRDNHDILTAYTYSEIKEEKKDCWIMTTSFDGECEA
jgi:hypothetical protein